MYDVVTIGSATQDIFLKGINLLPVEGKCFVAGKGICFPLGAKIRVPQVYFFTGGSATNTATTFARYGLNTGIICRLGKDNTGLTILQELQQEKVDTSLIQIDYVLPTAFSLIFLTSDGERTIFSYKGAGDKISLEEILGRKIKTRWLYLGSLGRERNILKNIIKFAKEKKFLLAINPGWRELEWLKKNPQWLKYFEVFIVNQEEAAYFTGIPYNQEKKLFKKLDNLIQGIVVMTKASRGVVVSDGHYLWKAGVFSRKKPVDLTGAGDAFASGFMAVLIKSSSINNLIIEKGIRVGSLNASSVIQYIGTKAGILKHKEYKTSLLSKLKIRKRKLC